MDWIWLGWMDFGQRYSFQGAWVERVLPAEYHSCATTKKDHLNVCSMGLVGYLSSHSLDHVSCMITDFLIRSLGSEHQCKKKSHLDMTVYSRPS